ncbi:MAG: hypothetical protein ACO2ZZ_06400 [Cyclobacteriaceae bacterium]|jgi:hypothetical protein
MKSVTYTPKTVRNNIHKYLKLITWFVIMVAFAILNEAKAQQIYGSVFAQNTIAGLQQGTEIGYTGSKNFGVGVFFQSTEVMSLERSIENYPFYGVSLQVPIKANCNGLSFVAQARTGLVNHEFIVVTPQLETQLDVNQFIKLGLNMSYRAGHSAIGARLVLTL